MGIINAKYCGTDCCPCGYIKDTDNEKFVNKIVILNNITNLSKINQNNDGCGVLNLTTTDELIFKDNIIDKLKLNKIIFLQKKIKDFIYKKTKNSKKKAINNKKDNNLLIKRNNSHEFNKKSHYDSNKLLFEHQKGYIFQTNVPIMLSSDITFEPFIRLTPQKSNSRILLTKNKILKKKPPEEMTFKASSENSLIGDFSSSKKLLDIKTQNLQTKNIHLITQNKPLDKITEKVKEEKTEGTLIKYNYNNINIDSNKDIKSNKDINNSSCNIKNAGTENIRPSLNNNLLIDIKKDDNKCENESLKLNNKNNNNNNLKNINHKNNKLETTSIKHNNLNSNKIINKKISNNKINNNIHSRKNNNKTNSSSENSSNISSDYIKNSNIKRVSSNKIKTSNISSSHVNSSIIKKVSSNKLNISNISKSSIKNGDNKARNHTNNLKYSCFHNSIVNNITSINENNKASKSIPKKDKSNDKINNTNNIITHNNYILNINKNSNNSNNNIKVIGNKGNIISQSNRYLPVYKSKNFKLFSFKNSKSSLNPKNKLKPSYASLKLTDKAFQNLNFEHTITENEFEPYNIFESTKTNNNIASSIYDSYENGLALNFNNYNNNHTIIKYDLDNSKTKGDFLLLNKTQKFKYKGRKNHMNKKYGFGEIYWENGSSLKGFFKDSKIDGICEFRYGNSVFYGDYSYNIPKGYGFFARGKYCLEGDCWIRNSLDNVGIGIWDEGDIYEGEFLGCKKHGIGTYYFPDGSIYKGEWKNDLMHGYGIIKYKNESKYVGQFKNGKIHGWGQFFFKTGNVFYGNYENEIKQGFGIFLWNLVPFTAVIGFWENGKVKGVCLKIKGNTVSAVYKKSEKEEKVLNPYDLYKHFGKKQKVYKNFFEQKPKMLLKFIEDFLDVNNEIMTSLDEFDL